jgi:hypothetical protein
MRHCKKGILDPVPVFLAITAFFVPVVSAPSQSGANAKTILMANAAPPVPFIDTSLIVEDLSKPQSLPGAASVSTHTPTAAPKIPAGAVKEITRVSTAADTLQVNTREMFRNLGTFHKAMGIYTVAAGALAVVVGAAILDRQDILPYSLSLITLGGITAGIGVWEIAIGRSISK